MSARIVQGEASIPVWDQAHAEALDRLRRCDAFVLITWADLEDGDAVMRALAKSGGAPILLAMLATSVAGLCEAYEDAEEL